MAFPLINRSQVKHRISLGPDLLLKETERQTAPWSASRALSHTKYKREKEVCKREFISHQHPDTLNLKLVR